MVSQARSYLGQDVGGDPALTAPRAPRPPGGFQERARAGLGSAGSNLTCGNARGGAGTPPIGPLERRASPQANRGAQRRRSPAPGRARHCSEEPGTAHRSIRLSVGLQGQEGAEGSQTRRTTEDLRCSPSVLSSISPGPTPARPRPPPLRSGFRLGIPASARGGVPARPHPAPGTASRAPLLLGATRSPSSRCLEPGHPLPEVLSGGGLPVLSKTLEPAKWAEFPPTAGSGRACKAETRSRSPVQPSLEAMARNFLLLSLKEQRGQRLPTPTLGAGGEEGKAQKCQKPKLKRKNCSIFKKNKRETRKYNILFNK